MKFVDACSGYLMAPRDKALVLLAIHTGARSTELLSCDNAHLDLIERRVTFTNTKGRRVRVVYFPPSVAAYLRAYVKWREILFPTSTHVFPSIHGTKMRVSELRGLMRRLGIHSHQLRHTFATEMLRRSHDVRLVQDLLGHASLATTARYLSVFDEQRRDAAMLFDSTIHPSREA